VTSRKKVFAHVADNWQVSPRITVNLGMRWEYYQPMRVQTSTDRTLNVIQSYIYELPFGAGKHFLSHGLAGKAIGGWQASGIFEWRTGMPLSFTGCNSLNLGSGGNAMLDQIAPIQVLGGVNSGNPWFSISSFAKAPANVQGTTGRNIFSGPGLISQNAALSRWIVLREQTREASPGDAQRHRHPQFSNPNTTFGSNFGFVTSTIASGTGVNGTGGARVVQLGAKAVF